VGAWTSVAVPVAALDMVRTSPREPERNVNGT
jgi:hypothetical protein